LESSTTQKWRRPNETAKQERAKVKGAKPEIQTVRANKQILKEYIY